MKLTKAQNRALKSKHNQLRPTGQSFLSFRRTAQSTFGMDGATIIYWCGMWLVIETCGYCHS